MPKSIDNWTGGGQKPTAAAAATAIARSAEELVREAARLGLVLTIEQRPLQPLAMGHHETTVVVRPARPLVAAFGFRIDVSNEGVPTFEFFGDRLEELTDDRRDRLQAAMQAMAVVIREHLEAQR